MPLCTDSEMCWSFLVCKQHGSVAYRVCTASGSPGASVYASVLCACPSSGGLKVLQRSGQGRVVLSWTTGPTPLVHML